MSSPGNTAKVGAAHSNIQTAQSSPPGWDRTCSALVSTPLSQHSNPLCQPEWQCPCIVVAVVYSFYLHESQSFSRITTAGCNMKALLSYFRQSL